MAAEPDPIHSTDKAGRPTQKEAKNSLKVGLNTNETVEKALAELEKALGGRDHLVSSLQLVPELTQEQETILNLLADPENSKKSLAYLCGSVGTTVGRLLELFTKGDFAAAYVKSIRKVYKMLPDVAEDAMSRALPKKVRCMTCLGKGEVHRREKVTDDEGKPLKPVQWKEWDEFCYPCEGSGKVEQEPDLERQKVALQMGQLLKTGGGVVVNANQNTANVSLNLIKSSPDFRSAVGKLLYPGRDVTPHQLPQGTEPENFITSDLVVEGEVVPPDPGSE